MSNNLDTAFINLEKIAVKSMRIQHQLLYLKAAVYQNFLPRGIGDQMKFVCSVKDPYLQDLCENIMYFAGSRILDTLILYYSAWSTNLCYQPSYYAELARTRKQLDDVEFCQVLTKVNQSVESERNKSMKTHHNKLLRDRERLQYLYTPVNNIQQVVEQTSKNVSHKRKKKTTKKKCRNKRRTQIKGEVPSTKTIPKEQLNNCVIDLTTNNEQLNEHQLLLLHLGKSFAPTPKLPTYETFREDVLQLAYKLRWA